MVQTVDPTGGLLSSRPSDLPPISTLLSPPDDANESLGSIVLAFTSWYRRAVS